MEAHRTPFKRQSRETDKEWLERTIRLICKTSLSKNDKEVFLYDKKGKGYGLQYKGN
ncbi:hypothetical protein St703_12990 [Sporolactobacillus terrae]|uniref:Uncharacterized protein n=1 Tax=Sporolactobacillus terrae TaxID=269673 RepID=A0A5K7WY19_9BACL|nr:hypothetical protein St703_12990 [Sporolactobacillus terrae]